MFFGRDGGRIGGRYMKVIYKEYTNNTFTTKKTPTPDSEHLGLLGKTCLFNKFYIWWNENTLYFLVHWCLVFHISPFLVTLVSCICPGPVLRAEEGDTLRVTFMNKADRNYSIQPHGLHYDKRFQGSSYEDGKKAAGYFELNFRMRQTKRFLWTYWLTLTTNTMLLVISNLAM